MNKIWSVIPENIKEEYKRISEELEKLNRPSELIIRPFDPKSSVRKKKPKENKPRDHEKKSKYKEDNALKSSKNLHLTEPTPPAKPTLVSPSGSCPEENLSSIGFIGNSLYNMYESQEEFNVNYETTQERPTSVNLIFDDYFSFDDYQTANF